MKPWAMLAITVAGIVGAFVISGFAGNLWLARGLILLLLLGCGLLVTPPLTLLMGMFGMVADLYATSLYATSSSTDALHYLVWAVFVGLPPYVANRWQLTQFQFLTMSASNPGPAPSDPAEPSASNRNARDIESMKLDPSLRDASDSQRENLVQDFQELVTRRLEEAKERFNFDNLLIYRRHRRQAYLSYVLTSVGQIDREQTFKPDVGQGVGRVLRHRDQQVWKGEEIDWRTLRYHNQEVELGRVQMEPLLADDEFIGVMVMEWEQSVEVETEQLNKFKSEIGLLLQLEVTVKRLEKNQHQLKLMEELHRLNPVEIQDVESIIQRALELVADFIPAENIEFFRHQEGKDRKVLHQGRRRVYEKCMRWIQQRGGILRLNDVPVERLGGEKLVEKPQLDMRSFLGGAVQTDEELFGMICLDHTEPRYFTSEDERLLRLLLNQLSQALMMERHVRNKQEEQSYQKQMINLLSEVSATGDLEDQAETVCDQLEEKLPIVGAAVYWREEDEMKLLYYSGEGRPTEQQSVSRPLINRLREHPDQPSIGFPDLSRLERYEGPVDAESMRAIPVFDTDRNRSLLGFLNLFMKTSDHLQHNFHRGLMEVRELLVDRFRQVHHRVELQKKVNRDHRSEVMNLDAWRQVLRLAQEEESVEHLTVWAIYVPGYDTIGRSEGIERLNHWMQSISTLLLKHFEAERLARSHGGTFFGFNLAERNAVVGTLEEIVSEIETWSFPAGDWPAQPNFGVETFYRPFPAVEEMIDGAHYQSKRKQEREAMT